MSKEKRRVPKLRFPGFTEDWEQRKFGDLFEYERPDAYIVKSDNYNNDFNMPVLTANKAFILGYTNEENSYNKPSIIFDDFTLDRKYVDFPYMLKSSAIKILTSKNQHNLRFLFERLNSTRFEVLGHARHYISVVQNTTTLCPSVDEEVCISNLLTKFDELITLHQRKLDNFKLKKKALLQKLFPKNGERYPELRFPGFTDAWEQRKLEDICSYQSSSLTINDIDENGQYDLYDANSLIGKTNKGYMKMEYITIIKDGAGVGRTRMLPKNSMFLGTMGALTPKNSYLGFLYQLVTNANLGKICTGSTIPHIYFKDYGKLKFCIPSIIEQEVIGKFFNNIDYLITLHQRKLDHLQLQKKALLQQMFV